MEDEAVCLGCGLVVGGPAASSCHCAPRSVAPASSASYRTAPAAARCPRCEERLLEGTLEDALVLSCDTCGGVFLSRTIIDRLGEPGSGALRVAFPRRPRAPEPVVVRYLSCPVCAVRMNRVNFGRSANVLVDVCKEDGIWFDAGEVHAVIDFVEQGGLERARQRAQREREEENAKLRAEWRKVHDESVRAMTLNRRQVHLSPGERQLAATFFDWIKR